MNVMIWQRSLLVVIALVALGGCGRELLDAARFSKADAADAQGDDATQDAADAAEDTGAGVDAIKADVDTADADAAIEDAQPACPTDCDDKNPCTKDSCLAGSCDHAGLTGAPCSDGDACTEADQCNGGACTAGQPKKCNSPDVCITAKCSPVDGACKYSDAPDGNSCNDNSKCTDADSCKDGACKGKAISCDDSEPCTIDLCEAATGCVHEHTDKSCDDDNPCTMADTCADGACKPGKPKVCVSDNACLSSKCGIDGKCKLSEVANGGTCDDGNPCTETDTCSGGSCGGNVKACDDKNPCTADSCNAQVGCTAAPLNAACDDGNACTLDDECDIGGKCVGLADASTTSCDDKNPCTTDTCSPSIGCLSVANTQACDDGNSCTVGDACQGKACVSGPGACECSSDGDCLASDDGNACNGTLVCDNNACKLKAGSAVVCDISKDSKCNSMQCDSKTGVCGAVSTQDGTPCDDGNACTQGDACSGGVCNATTAITCNDNNLCTIDSCDKAGGCQYLADSVPCDADGNLCTVNDTCKDKVCLPGAKKACDDNEPCTQDSCQTATGACKFDGSQQQGVACDGDGSVCTEGDACSGGLCKIGTVKACKDGNGCTDDSCDAKQGCVFKANSAKCDDGNACTKGDECAQSACGGIAFVIEKDCNDDNLCTDDGCDKTTGCSHGANTLPCEDGLACSKGDACAGKVCVAGSVCACQNNSDCKAEEDKDLCNGTLICDTTSDVHKCLVDPATVVLCPDVTGKTGCKANSCNQTTGKCETVVVNVGKSCTDGSACTDGDLCASDGACTPGTAIGCNDNNPCTDDACDVASGCTFINNTAACTDGNACTGADTCSTGACAPGKVTSCDDGNTCTTDSCDKTTGCKYSNLNGTCSDGNACTLLDNCQAASCVGQVAPVCDDGNTCTTDSCDPTAGCVNTAVSIGTCSFGMTAGTCTLGVCSSAVKPSVVAIGNDSMCMASASSAWCWGDGSKQQLGTGFDPPYATKPSTPVNFGGVMALANITSMAVGDDHACAINGGVVRCWGINDYGQLGDGTNAAAKDATTGPSFKNGSATTVSAGSHTTCATVNSSVYCWGSNAGGVLGFPTDGATNHSTPVLVGSTTGATTVTVGEFHACTLIGGAVKCWGLNASGQLGDGSTTNALTPVQVVGAENGATSVSCGGNSTCAVVNGAARCWGENSLGQLGNGTATLSKTAVLVQGITGTVSTVDVGMSTACARTTAGAVYCWGANAKGTLGNGFQDSKITAGLVSGLSSGASSVWCGADACCATLTSGGLKCWGSNANGKLGIGAAPIQLTAGPTAYELTSGVTGLTAAYSSTLAVIAGGYIRGWGKDNHGVLGDGGQNSRAQPYPVPGLAAGFTKVSTSGFHSCAISASGGLWCWGFNNYGQLGNGAAITSLTPVAATSFPSGVASVTAGSGFTCVLTTAGAVQCWGYNGAGSFGNGETTEATPNFTPVTVTGLSSGVTLLAQTPGLHNCAIVAGGVKCWGANAAGQVGDGTVVSPKTTAVSVTGISTATELALGSAFSCARLSNSTVKCWGSNASGQLGDGNVGTVAVSTPVAVQNLTDASSLCAGNKHACAVTSSGAVKCWGYNASGQLGNSTTKDSATYVVAVSSGATAVVCGESHTCALIGGGVKCWGNNSQGQIGDQSAWRLYPAFVLGTAQ